MVGNESAVDDAGSEGWLVARVPYVVLCRISPWGIEFEVELGSGEGIRNSTGRIWKRKICPLLGLGWASWYIVRMWDNGRVDTNGVKSDDADN